MKKSGFDGLPADALWALYAQVSGKLEEKMIAEQKVLEGRLAALKISSAAKHQERTSERRPYPPVLAKFRNPDDPSQTWAGRGRQPHWFMSQLRSGRAVDDLRIQRAAE